MIEHFTTLLQRSIFEVLRLVLVDQGYTPDITEYENTPEDYRQYLTDLSTIRAEKGFAVELFNKSPTRDKGLKKVPRITLDYAPLGTGAWGSEGKPYPILDGNSFKYYKDDLVSLEMLFYCRVVTESTSQARFLNQLILQVLPPISFHPYYISTPKEYFLVEFISQSDVSDPQMNTTEHVSLYRVPDIVANDQILVNKEVPPISNIEISYRLGLS